MYGAATSQGRVFTRDLDMAAAQKREQELLTSIDDLAAASALAQRDPLLYEEAVRAVAQDGSVQKVYVPATGLAHALGGMEAVLEDAGVRARLQGILDMLGMEMQTFAEAISSGGDLVAPVEKYAAAVAQDKEFASLTANDRRLTPDGFTSNELRQFARDNADSMRELLNLSAPAAARANQLATEAGEIHQTVKSQLEAVGTDSKEATAQATQVAAFFATMASRTGQSPRALWHRYAPDVRRGEDGGVIEASEALTPVGYSSTVSAVHSDKSALAPGERKSDVLETLY